MGHAQEYGGLHPCTKSYTPPPAAPHEPYPVCAGSLDTFASRRSYIGTTAAEIIGAIVMSCPEKLLSIFSFILAL